MPRDVAFVLSVLLLAAPALAADPTPPAPAVAAPTVTVTPATRAEVQSRVPISGTLVARREVQVFPQVAGFEITELLAEAGDTVRAGQPLARLSATTLTAQMAQAEAELQRAEAAVGQARSLISSAEAGLTQAVTALQRARRLKTSGNAAQATLDQAVAAEAAAQAQAASARDGLTVAEAGLAQARAARDIARLNLDRTTILAPVDGFVAARSAQLGALSGGGVAPMFTLIAGGEIEVEGQVIEDALGQIKPGDPAELSVAGMTGIAGTVRLVPAAVDPATRLGLVRITLSPDPRLRTGMFASGSIVAARREAVTVPATAVLVDREGARVQVVRDGTVETRPVVAGVIWQGQREIVEGVAEGETVMARAGVFFRSGDPVVAVAEGAAVPPAEKAAP